MGLRDVYLQNIDAIREISQETKSAEIEKRCDDLIVIIGQQIGNCEFIENKMAQITQAIVELQVKHAENLKKLDDSKNQAVD